MMTNKNVTLILFSIFLITGCQQVPVATDNGGGNSGNGTIEYTSGIELCDDGTLNCYVDIPEPGQGGDIVNNTTIISDPMSVFNACMSGCFEASTSCGAHADEEDFLNVEDFDPALEGACEEEVYPTCFDHCSGVLNVGGIANAPPSDPLVIPENSKALTVTLRACMSEGENSFIFNGPSISTKKVHAGSYKVKDWTSRRVDLPQQTSFDEACPSALGGKIQVTFKPHKEDSIAIGSETVQTIPFSNEMPNTINFDWKMPYMTSILLPHEINNEVDFSQISWITTQMVTQPQSFSVQTNPLFFGAVFSSNTSLPNFIWFTSQYDNRKTFTDTITTVGVLEPSGSPIVEFKTLVFIKAK